MMSFNNLVVHLHEDNKILFLMKKIRKFGRQKEWLSKSEKSKNVLQFIES